MKKVIILAVALGFCGLTLTGCAVSPKLSKAGERAVERVTNRP